MNYPPQFLPPAGPRGNSGGVPPLNQKPQPPQLSGGGGGGGRGPQQQVMMTMPPQQQQQQHGMQTQMMMGGGGAARGPQPMTMMQPPNPGMPLPPQQQPNVGVGRGAYIAPGAPPSTQQPIRQPFPTNFPPQQQQQPQQPPIQQARPGMPVAPQQHTMPPGHYLPTAPPAAPMPPPFSAPSAAGPRGGFPPPSQSNGIPPNAATMPPPPRGLPSGAPFQPQPLAPPAPAPPQGFMQRSQQPMMMMGGGGGPQQQLQQPPPQPFQQQHQPPPPPYQHLTNNQQQQQPLAHPNLSQPPLITFASGILDPSGIPVQAPAPDSHYVCLDNGYSSPRFIRLTSRVVPATSSTLSEIALPLAAFVEPFADPMPGELPVPVSTWSHESGPVRCTRCRGYLSCFANVSSDLTKWECNLCGNSCDVPEVFRSFVQANYTMGPPVEMRSGTVEFEVSQAYGQTSPDRKNFIPQPYYCVVLDATAPSLRNGMFRYSLHVVQQILKSVHMLAGGANAKIGLVTFDEETVQFYDAVGKDHPRVLVVSDYDNGFSPLPPNKFLISVTDEDMLARLFNVVLQRFEGATAIALSKPQQQATMDQASSVCGAALMCACDALKSTGGRVVWLTSQLPTLGQGRLLNRELPSLIGRDEENLLFVPPEKEMFFNNLAVACVQSDICIDVFALGAAFVDAATLVQLSSTTGGKFHRCAGFYVQNPVHKQSLDRALRHSFRAARAAGVTLKARTSNGLRVVRYVSHGFPDDGTLRAACMTNDMCVVVELEHDGTKLEPGKSQAFVQVAILYTSMDSKRRLRVFNVSLPARENPAEVAQSFDALAVAGFWAKRWAIGLSEKSIPVARKELTASLTDAVNKASKRRGSAGMVGFLPVPEGQELLPLYITSLLKSPAMLVNKPLEKQHQEPFARADARVNTRYQWLSAGLGKFSKMVYPALYDVSDPSKFGDAMGEFPSVNGGQPTGQSYCRLPPRYPATSEHLRTDGIFLIWDGGDEMDLFVGPRADPIRVEALLGVPSPRERVAVLSDSRRNDPYVTRVVTVGRALMELDQHDVLAVNVVSMGEMGDIKCFAKLVEDKIYVEPSYAGWIQTLHGSLTGKD